MAHPLEHNEQDKNEKLFPEKKIHHQPVLLKEVLEILQPQKNHTYIDGTLGLAGHSKAILNFTPDPIQLIGFDRDFNSLEIASSRLSEFRQSVKTHHARFSEIPNLIDKTKIQFPIGGILLDLGISSFQLDDPEYGLTFNGEGLKKNLDMRLDEWCSTSADKIINEWAEKKLADLFWDYSDYKHSRKLAKLITQNRPVKKMEEFVALCKSVQKSKSRIHPATLPLMALRIIVNDEYKELEKGLRDIVKWMEPASKLLVISFHSGEDRIVKNIFKEHKTQLKFLNMKPITPSQKEIKENPRSRSAKLRAVCKI
ncbi:MAG: 16S rRNA (cytosine(1402)-N(4))-methyltransferase RsmH [Candidatus Caenarcaniphilales bacterium]|nr:16S rRNA (cytosine(1402)-N(4))-methyltransferase RsmH [Candidatus Caenarcaniphilales bacterium]